MISQIYEDSCCIITGFNPLDTVGHHAGVTITKNPECHYNIENVVANQ